METRNKEEKLVILFSLILQVNPTAKGAQIVAQLTPVRHNDMDTYMRYTRWLNT